MNRFFKIVLKYWPFLFLLAIWVIFSSPYFFHHKVPYPSKYQVSFFGPWGYYPQFAGPVKNNAMPDVIDQMYPWKYFTIQSLKQGQLPYWNPYNFAGTPYIANFQTAVFSPFNLLFFVLPFIDAWSVLVLIQLVFAGLFTYLYLREVGVSKSGSVISGITFMFCGFVVTWLAYGTMAMAISWLPLILLSIDKIFSSSFRLLRRFTPRNDIGWGLVLSFSIAISYFSGHVQTSLYLTVFSLSYLILKGITTKDWTKFAFAGLFFVLGLAVTLIQVIPTLELYAQSVRSSIVYHGGQIPLQYLVTIFAPDFYGNPVTRNDWMSYYQEWAGFIGIVPFTLAIVAIGGLFKKRDRHTGLVLFFSIAGILAVMFASDTPLRHLLEVSRIPVFATSIPSRMIVLFSFSFAVLAGFGLDALRENIEKKLVKKTLIPFGIVGLLLLVIWVVLIILHVLPADKMSLAVRNLVLPTFLFALLVVCVAAVWMLPKLLPHKISKFILPIGFGFILLLTTFDGLRFAQKWMPFDDRSLVFPDVPIIKEIKAHQHGGRVYGSFGTQVEPYYAIQSIEGYDPLYIGRYGEFIRTANTGKFEEAERSLAQLYRRGKYTDRILDLLGVTLIVEPKSYTFQGWAYPVWVNREQHVVVYEDDLFQLFQNTTALSRAKLFYNYEVIPDGKKLLSRFYTDNFDFRNVLLLEEDPGLTKNHEARIMNQENLPVGKVEIESYTPNKVTITVESDRAALLFLSDSYYPNWKAFINGKETKIYRADYAFRAVKVPEGKSTVEFVYRGLF